MSLVESNKTDTNRYRLEISVDREPFQKAINSVYNKQKKRINIPGFRKGKAPRAIIEKMYGKEFFYEDAMQQLYPSALVEAAKEAQLRMVADDPELELVEVSEDGFTFKASVTVYPEELTVGEYKGIEIAAVSDEVTDKAIDEQIENARRRASRVEPVEDRPAQDGDTVSIDFEGFLNGEPFEGGKAEEYSLTLGSHSFIPGFEEQIIGHSADEEFTINVTFPEDYQTEELAGKPAEFKIKLHEISTRVLPELNNDFVEDVSEEATTVEEYRKEIADELSGELKEARDNDITNKLCEKLVDMVEGDIPEAMYENRIDDMIRELELRVQRSNITLETYMSYLGLDEEGLREQYRNDAEKSVKLRLALEKIAELENIEAADEELNEKYAELAKNYSITDEKVREVVKAEDLALDIKVEKAMRLVKDSAVVTTEENTESEETSEDE